ncbi:hypothetical protein H0H93_001467 [Arthromyces matolae]|nr:hypothetical protein H0H93_001467 [Arthromyces matolae]
MSFNQSGERDKLLVLRSHTQPTHSAINASLASELVHMSQPSFPTSSDPRFDALVKGKLISYEHLWVSYHPFLLSKGYRLRPRYDPNWQPSWKDCNLSSPHDIFDYEDSLTLSKGAVAIDARRVADNRHVILKKIKASSEELRIAKILSSEPLASDPRNHTVPILDILYHPDDNVAFIVMPILLHMNFLPFRRLGEFANAMHQYLTGLQFMHEHNIAHRDACFFNLMVDATLIPGGFHYCRKYKAPDGVTQWKIWKERSAVESLRYHYIDFGLSRQYSTNLGILDVGISGQDQSCPEQSLTIPYDPFKTDIYQLGNVMLQMVKKYDGLECFSPMGEAMTRQRPEERASLSDVLAMLNNLKPRQLKQRVWDKENPKVMRFCIKYFGTNLPCGEYNIVYSSLVLIEAC